MLKDKVKNILIKEKKYVSISLFLGVLIFSLFIFFSKVYSENIQSSIANELIRFHILANSDSEEDQNLKMKVKDEVINMLENELKSSSSKLETKKFLNENMERIIECAERVILENGYNYSVTAKITNSYFPTKVYGDITLPAGEYEALQIKIGDAKGQNWWCVMFPPLCFVDVTFNEIDIKDKIILQNILSDDEYELISNGENEKDVSIKIKFKIIEFWQNLFNND